MEGATHAMLSPSPLIDSEDNAPWSHLQTHFSVVVLLFPGVSNWKARSPIAFLIL